MLFSIRYPMYMNKVAAALLIAGFCRAENPAAMAAHNWRIAHEQAILAEFTELLAIPNLASDMPNIRRNAAAITAMLDKRGVKTRLLETEGAPPVVYGEIAAPTATRT